MVKHGKKYIDIKFYYLKYQVNKEKLEFILQYS